MTQQLWEYYVSRGERIVRFAEDKCRALPQELGIERTRMMSRE